MHAKVALPRSASPTRCAGAVVISSLLLLLAGCLNYNYSTMQPVDLKPKRYDADLLVEGIMNPRGQPLQAGDTIRILTVDQRSSHGVYVFLSRNDTTFFLQQPSLFSKIEIQIPVDDIVFLEKRVRRTAYDSYSVYPVLDETASEDTGLSCQQLERAIIHVDVLRKAVNLQIWLAHWVGAGPGPMIIPGLKDAKFRAQIANESLAARDAATARLVHLLRLWQVNRCSSSTIGNGKAGTGQILAEFERLTLEKDVPRSDVTSIDSAIQKNLDRLR